MTERQAQILRSVVKEYTASARPVASSTLNKNYHAELSPALIRLELVSLEDQGYLSSPHTSAGRVPTDKGYRFYVNSLEQELSHQPRRESQLLTKRVAAYESEAEQARAAADTLSELTRTLAISLLDDHFYSYGLARVMQQPEFAGYAEMFEFARLLDSLDDIFDEIGHQRTRTGIFIGRETPYGKSAGAALVFSRFRSKHSDRNFIGVIGPMRMPYEKTIPLVEYVSDLLEEKDDEER